MLWLICALFFLVVHIKEEFQLREARVCESLTKLTRVSLLVVYSFLWMYF
ncbi:hypothetical protein RchiOBHm_Chr7g0199721 [Rosa chinensis]|uniref:Uncharacterized protein n=1 Tax=Rosa chinensis TaxID=74649 RepID=A0A2P6P7H6_ROSCH|nr:hypothetical protein RchiOBHm_Chr7g0199721 [Rosa chinensis]